MKGFSRAAWQLAVLLTILFGIAAMAVRVTISYLEDMPLARTAHGFPFMTYAILALTLGFMCIAAAFGLWAMRAGAEAEARRRIARFIEAMDCFSDALLGLTDTGRISSMNPAAKVMCGPSVPPGSALIDAFPCLTSDDVSTLLSRQAANEIERDMVAGDGRIHTLRFRSQPSEGILIVVISDVSVQKAEAQRRQQVSRLQLVGRLARGVAHDFNSILCAISGHGALVRRLKPGSPDAVESLQAIAREAERGIALSRHLLDLSHSGVAGPPTGRLSFYAHRATEMLRITLSPGWTIDSTVEPRLGTVPLSGIQIEQIIVNLGLAASDRLSGPGAIRITIDRPSADDHLLNVDPSLAAVLVISASLGTGPRSVPSPAEPIRDDDTGIILSVVRSMIEAEGGALDVMGGGSDSVLYRVLLPCDRSASAQPETDLFPDSLVEYVAGWQVLLAGRPEVMDRVEGFLRGTGAKVERAGTVVAALARSESNAALDVLLVDEELLGADTEALVRALIKVRPQTGIIVLSQRPPTEEGRPGLRGVLFEPATIELGRILQAMIEAKGLAYRQS